MQYTFAALGFLVGLLGTFGLIGIEVGISSGMLIASAMTRPLTYVFIAVFMGHLTLIYMFHASAPQMEAKISLGIDKAKIVDEGRKQAEQQLSQALPQLGAAISARLVAEVMHDLNLTAARGEVLEGQSLPMIEAAASPAPSAKVDPMALLKGWFLTGKKRDRRFEHVAAAPGATDAKQKVSDVEARTRIVHDGNGSDFMRVPANPSPDQPNVDFDYVAVQVIDKAGAAAPKASSASQDENQSGGGARVDVSNELNQGADGGGSMQASPTNKKPIVKGKGN
jgi:hypothetical protein